MKYIYLILFGKRSLELVIEIIHNLPVNHDGIPASSISWVAFTTVIEPWISIEHDINRVCVYSAV